LDEYCSSIDDKGGESMLWSVFSACTGMFSSWSLWLETENLKANNQREQKSLTSVLGCDIGKMGDGEASIV
jgi:hypothetical protein